MTFFKIDDVVEYWLDLEHEDGYQDCVGPWKVIEVCSPFLYQIQNRATLKTAYATRTFLSLWPKDDKKWPRLV